MAGLAMTAAVAAAAGAEAAGAAPVELARLTETLERAWERTRAVYYSPKTHLYYGAPLAQVSPAKVFTNGFLDPDKDKAGYGQGMEDCPIFGGLLLSMFADRFAVTGEASLAEPARDVFAGLELCATVHGVPGFVARGICLEDGKSVCLTSSRDQYTHFVHGLWRYYHSRLCDAETKGRIRTQLRAVAERMRRNVTPENDYDFLRADGSRDPRGICRMWNVLPHEAARLPMFYAAAWDACRDETYLRLYRQYLEPALDHSLTLPSLPRSQLNRSMPTYSLLQMQTSLEVLLALETDARLKAKIAAAMKPVAEMAAERAIRVNGGEERYLCACGEAALAQLMAEDVPFPRQQVELLCRSIALSDPATVTSCRTIHLLSAFWRARRLGLLVPPTP